MEGRAMPRRLQMPQIEIYQFEISTERHEAVLTQGRCDSNQHDFAPQAAVQRVFFAKGKERHVINCLRTGYN